MAQRIPVDQATSLAWVEVAHSARIHSRILDTVSDPIDGSQFSMVDVLYPHERASNWHRSYLNAALEHLLVWADLVAPLRFHPEQESIHMLRPAYTLSRAAIEAASQAVWVSAGGSAAECVRRHLRLIRWDYEEHRKSVQDPEAKRRIHEMDETLLNRVREHVSADQLKVPSLLTVLREAAEVIGESSNDLERVWRAASGAAHGKFWPSVALQHVVPVDEHEPGQLRALSVPDAVGMTEVLRLAGRMTTWGVLRHADFCGFEIEPLVSEATQWLASVVPVHDDADPDVIARLMGRDHDSEPGRR